MWRLTDHAGTDIMPIFSIRMEQQTGMPATLRWTTPCERMPATVHLWYGDACLFKGNVQRYPVHVHDDLRTWLAVAADDTVVAQKTIVLSALNDSCLLSTRLNDCQGATSGFIQIDPVTHGVRWVSLERPDDFWDTKGLHERDSVLVTPVDTPLTGILASVVLTNQRQENGMMEVGEHITALLGRGIETYSGDALEDQWSQLTFRALKAGYDVQRAALSVKRYQRADLPKVLSFKDDHDHIVTVPYSAYAAELLLSWSIPVTSHTTIRLAQGKEPEALTLTLKECEVKDVDAILTEMIAWAKAYALRRSFNTHVKARIMVDGAIALSALETGRWARLMDPRVSELPIEGPIIAYALTSEEGVTWVDLTMVWAPDLPLPINPNPTLLQANQSEIDTPKAPSDIIASVILHRGAADQYAYVQANPSLPFEPFVEQFPMTQLDIVLTPVLPAAIEQIEQVYQ